MVLLRKTLHIVLALCVTTSIQAGVWRTHFAYNNVMQIAMAEDKVYAVSDGSLYSVDKQTEAIQVYNNQSGLHSTGIQCIHYDALGKQLIIGYGNGKIDLLSNSGVKYIGELYDKDMTQRKTIYNVTIQGRTAYLSTHYGIQTMDLRENKLVDSYWLRPGGQETPIKDVLIANDSIYAFTDDSLYCARMTDNIVDYRVWKREKSGRVTPDTEKGVHYQDASGHWYASQGEGIVRFTTTERLSYKPNGPLVNTPYRIRATHGHVWVVPGGRWASQYFTPGVVMHYDGSQWTNVTTESIQAKTGMVVYDFMHVAVDPKDLSHYFVTSYGTGFYEFRHDTLVRHDIAGGNNTLVAINPSSPSYYTRLDYMEYDSEGNLWMLDACTYDQLQCLDASRVWHAVTVQAGDGPLALHTPGGLIIDNQHPHHKWIGVARYGTGIGLLDDQGTWTDTDDQFVFRSDLTDQNGKNIHLDFLHSLEQSPDGRVFVGTESGLFIIHNADDFLQTGNCFRPELTDDNGDDLLGSQFIMGVAFDPEGRIWVGTGTKGIYVLNSSATNVLAHYSTDNTAMPSDNILSLGIDETGKAWIGTSEGLVEYDPNGPGEGLNGNASEGNSGMEEGSMLNWKLHFSYTNPQEMAATPSAIYAIGNGSLFSVNRADESIRYWNKSTGMSGTTVAHIAYDEKSGKLIVAYENGQLDLVDDNGGVISMTDISLKAGSMAVTVNAICPGKNACYLAMPFGIIALNLQRAEVSDTYYIGDDAASIEVQQVVEMGDSLYAFSFDKLYRASLQDNLVDFSFWKSEAIPFEQVTQAASVNQRLYVLAHDSLYRRENSGWKLVSSLPTTWMHASHNRLLAYQDGQGMVELNDDDSWTPVTRQYTATDGLYTNGEYWLAEEDKGLVRLGKNGDDRFIPESPLSNFGYHLDIVHDRLYVSPGGRWTTEYGRMSSLSIYDGQQWTGIPWQDTWYYTNHAIRDAVQYAVDSNDPGHFFVTTYGTGVFEFKDYKGYQHYDSSNSTLRKTTADASDYFFTRTDGAMMDAQGNLWVLNATQVEGGRPVHVRTASGYWCGLRLRSGGKDLTFETPAGIWVDQRSSQYKWLVNQRSEPMLVLLDDGGTPTVNGDDRCMARSSFIDQDGKQVTPSQFRCWVQDANDRIWVGTDKGIILIPKEVDFFSSNTCKRIIIPRNDGTGLGDYLLGDEQINCMAVDGGNRIWIGTANSGLYLIEDDTITVAHFTETNSLLPSNSVQSIAIMPKTGEVFVGTDRGIASYRNDASEAKEDMSGAYAFPNPVRPNYGGYISITGLMENTVVNIVDAGGNLVCKTRSHGGTAVWDGKLPDGRRATPGVYTALCNANGGHTVVKILVAY